ncbi:MAG TPA: hypothetical protein VHP33_00750 [Polyangiaceae bacterium]|nr:hypothetical protein [Polyangiaceae bacterium]
MAGFKPEGHCARLALAVLLSGCDLSGRQPDYTVRVSASAGSAGTAQAAAAGSGGAPASAGQGSGGTRWVSPVAPEIAQHWTWQECGRILPNPADASRHEGYIEIFSLAISSDGSLLVSDAYRTIGWRVADVFADSEPLWRIGAEGGTNVALSPDGRFGTISGDVRLIFDTTTGEKLFGEGAEAVSGVPIGSLCIGSEFNFSPDSRLVAGKHYLTTVEVIETDGFTKVGYLDTPSCAQGVVFSRDGSGVVTPDAAARLTDLAATPPAHHNADLPWSWRSLAQTPSGDVYQVECANDACGAAGISWPQPGGKHLAVSPEGQWVALGGKVRHLPSGEERVFDEAASEAVFAPNGDIIAGERDATLVRFCRKD